MKPNVNSASTRGQAVQGHTPGPWKAHTDMDGRHHSLSIMAASPEFNMDEGKEPYHPLIAGVLHGRGHAPREIAEANARLIAAAPDLLAERDRLLAVNKTLVEALEGTLYLLGAHAVSKTDLEQIAFARAALKAGKGE